MNRNLRVCLGMITVLGVALIVAPFALGLPHKTSAGHALLQELHPYMQPASVKATVGYLDDTLTPLGPVATQAVAAAPQAPKLITALSGELHLTPAATDQFLASRFPALAGLLAALPKASPVFANVPAALTHYRPLVATIQANVARYAAVDSLPDLRLFTWFLVVPGILLLLLAGIPLLVSRGARVRVLAGQ